MEDNTPEQEDKCNTYENNLSFLSDRVDNLYHLRDNYFENHSLEDAILKTSVIQSELDRVIDFFDEFKDCANYNRAKYYYLKGRALNINDDYNREVEEILSKAIKLDPKLVEAWNELGESYWKKNNLSEAKNCFIGALNQKNNKISLRNLSMITRQECCPPGTDRVKNIEKGLELAKEAVQLDPQDGQSWAVLGNSHLSYFFTVSQNPNILKKCLSAYAQAEKDPVVRNTSDFNYNKAITLKYEEEYKLALESFNFALKLSPTWDAPLVKEQQLVKYLNNVVDLVRTRGKMKGKKRLKQLIQSIDSKQLVPYISGSYKTPNGKPVTLTEVDLSDLVVGVNLEKIILGKVVCSVQNDDSVPFTFCIVDKNGDCMPVMVYNLAKGKGVIIGDSVGIPEPFVKSVKFNYKDKVYDFQSIRIETPLLLIVNGKRVSPDQEACVEMSIFKNVE